MKAGNLYYLFTTPPPPPTPALHIHSPATALRSECYKKPLKQSKFTAHIKNTFYMLTNEFRQGSHAHTYTVT